MAPVQVTELAVIPRRRAADATGVIALVTAGFKRELNIKDHRRLSQCNLKSTTSEFTSTDT